MYSLLMLFKVFMNSIMCASVIDGDFVRTKSAFISVRLSDLKPDIILKLNRGSDLFRKGLNWYSHSVMGSLEIHKFTMGINKSVEKMKQL